MAIPFLLEQLPDLLRGVEGGASMLNGLISSETAKDINTNNVTTSLQQQESNQNFLSAQNVSGQNFQTQMQANSFNQQNLLQKNSFDNFNSMQGNSFAQQNLLQSNAFQQQNSLTSQVFSNNMKAGAANAGLNLGSNLLSTGVNYLAQSSLMNQGAALQRQNFSYMTGQASQAYTAAGLPSWMPYAGSGAMSMMPRTSQVVAGMNSLNSQLPGNVQNIPWQGTPSQTTFGVGDVPTAF